MISFATIVGYIQNHTRRLYGSIIGLRRRTHTSWTKVQVMHTLRQFTHLIILLTILGLTLVYLIPEVAK